MDLTGITPSNFIEEEVIQDIQNGRVDRVWTRCPPEPTGYWHIGHCKAWLIDFETAVKFGGKTVLRMDDTNPTKEDGNFADSYLEDLKWLGYVPDRLVYSSEEYFDKIYDIAEKLIEKGLAYVCELSAEEVSKTRGTLTEAGINSPYRDRLAAESLRLFREMKAGKHKDGSLTLRAKIDMGHPNFYLRDPVMYRIMHVHHYRTGDKWCIYPSYDFAHPMEDALEGTTFSLCDNTFEVNRPLYNWYVEQAGFNRFNGPRQIEFGKLNIEGVLLGKRYIKQLVQSGMLLGWDDPRLLTIIGMKRRGYSASAVKDFIVRCSIAKTEGLVEFAALEACVREELNQKAVRAMAVLDPLKVVLTNFDQVVKKGDEICEMENFPGSEDKHTFKLTREIYIEQEDFSENPPPKYNRLTEGGVVRLKGAYIIRCHKIVKNSDGIDHLECEILEGTKSGSDASGIKAKGTIHFVSATEHLPIKVRNFSQLIKPEYKNLYKAMNDGAALEDVLAENSMEEKTAYAENYLASAKVGEVFQFLRKGYYCKDKDSTEKLPVFNLTVSLKETNKV